MKKIAKALVRPFVRPALKGAMLAFGRARTPDGYVIHISRDTHPMDYLNLLRGYYEAAEAQILRTCFRPADAILEIGANVGYVARVAMHEKLNPGGTIFCVEPNPRAHAALGANLAAAQKADPDRGYRIVPAALSTPGREGQTAEFMMRPNLSSGLRGHTARNISRETPAPVTLTSLSELMDKHVRGPAALVCDAEGAEIDMILQDRAGFKNVTQMSIELHDEKITGRAIAHETLLRELESMGFRRGARVSNTHYLRRP